MPKIKLKADEYIRQDFLKELRGQQAYYGRPKQSDLAAVIKGSQPTAGRRVNDPDSFTAGELRGVVQSFKLDIGVVLRFLGYSPAEIKKFRAG